MIRGQPTRQYRNSQSWSTARVNLEYWQARSTFWDEVSKSMIHWQEHRLYRIIKGSTSVVLAFAISTSVLPCW
ncbi:hypothetical protein BS17DRAFT_365294 [Gyrodon lividus]|nr:hypothetical protein BS17DRAFT_365294 [Gyrodon lividus]